VFDRTHAPRAHAAAIFRGTRLIAERVLTALTLYLAALEAQDKAALATASERDMGHFEWIMSERVADACFGNKAALCVADALARNDRAKTLRLDRFSDFCHHLRTIKDTFREEDDVWRWVLIVLCKARGTSDPACMTAHHFENKHLGR